MMFTYTHFDFNFIVYMDNETNARLLSFEFFVGFIQCWEVRTTVINSCELEICKRDL